MHLVPVAPICRTCGSPADPSQEYCLECGNRILPPRRAPAVATWIVPSVVALVVATAGAAAAIAATHDNKASGSRAIVALSPLRPAPPPRTTTPTTKTGKTQLIPWPAGNGYTIVLATLPLSVGAKAAQAKALSAVRDGLREVGVLVSSSYPSLQPGYYVVFSGVYASLEEAQSDLDTAKSSFPGAYARPIAR